MEYPPLAYPKPEDMPKIGREAGCCLLAPMAWVRWLATDVAHNAACQRSLLVQMRARETPPDPRIWTMAERGVAERLARVCKREMHWPNDHFIPEDSFDAMINWSIGDLCEVEALMAIEDEFGVNFPESVARSIERATMRDVVQWTIEAMRSTESGQRPPLRRGCLWFTRPLKPRP